MGTQPTSQETRIKWDNTWTQSGLAPPEIAPYPLFADHQSLFPTTGTALEVACGRGRGAVWLAAMGLEVQAVDLSPVAIDLARQHAVQSEVADRCHFRTHDLSEGLPPGNPVDVLVCYLFREADIDKEMMQRLKPGGLLAVAVLSEVDHGPGNFRAKPDELIDAFAALNIMESGERDGHAWLIARSTP